MPVRRKRRTNPTNQKNTSQEYSSNPTDVFYKEFIARYYDIALHDKTKREIKVIHLCRLFGGQHSESYSFGHNMDGMVRINKVVGATNSGFTFIVTIAGAAVVITMSVT